MQFYKDDFMSISSALRHYLPEKDTPYILDIDLDFFSTRNPFKLLYDDINLYDKLAPIYSFQRPDTNDPEAGYTMWPATSRIIDREGRLYGVLGFDGHNGTGPLST
uniref:Uncharacterized protein n=1 Tax=Vespula pensylvanica TaxID=30213 RepID=A0A834UE22_VESPE|nr:hypothetical protein H0235_002720 [Vespula pensylvanica]